MVVFVEPILNLWLWQEWSSLYVVMTMWQMSKAIVYLKQLFSRNVTQRQLWGGICLFKKTLMLYCFCSEAIINQAASLFEQSRLTVDGRELPTWTSQWNPKKWTMKYRNNHWLSTTLWKPRAWMQRTSFRAIFWGEICVFSVIALIFVGNVEWLKELPHWICCYPGAPLERHLCLCKSTATRPERVRNLPPVRRVGWFWVTQHHDRMCQNSAFSKLPKRNGARIHRNS